MSKKRPQLYIVAGPNGAGKTTFARKFLPEYVQCRQFVNADLIAQGLSPFLPEAAALQAGRLLREQIHALAEKKVDFGFETTLSGVTYVALMKKLKSIGYLLHLSFLWIPTVEIALARIADRVRRGGHHIPEKDVRRRFRRGLRNLFKLYRPMLDSLTIVNNSKTTPHVIAVEEEGKLYVADKDLFAKIKKEVES